MFFLYILAHMSRQKPKGIQKPVTKILLYGATGMLGTRFRELAGDKFKIVGPPHSHLDLFNKRDVVNNLKDVMPDKVVYVAGITRIDYAQQNPKETFKLNHEVIDFISKECAKLNIPVYYISTDAVFDGIQSSRPFKETDKPKSISTYGKSKLAGERSVLGASPKNAVIRTIMIYSGNFPHRKDFARAAYESLKNKIPFAGIVDQTVNPTFVDDIVKATFVLLRNNAHGIYHVAATDHLTNFEFVKKIARAFNFNEKYILKTTFAEFFGGRIAPRAQYSALDSSKFRKQFGEGLLKSTNKEIAEFKKQINGLVSSPIDV